MGKVSESQTFRDDAYLHITAGDAFVRELDVSKITLRLKQKHDKKGDADQDEHTIAKLHGSTLDILQRCLVRVFARKFGYLADRFFTV